MYLTGYWYGTKGVSYALLVLLLLTVSVIAMAAIMLYLVLWFTWIDSNPLAPMNALEYAASTIDGTSSSSPSSLTTHIKSHRTGWTAIHAVSLNSHNRNGSIKRKYVISENGLRSNHHHQQGWPSISRLLSPSVKGSIGDNVDNDRRLSPSNSLNTNHANKLLDLHRSSSQTNMKSSMVASQGQDRVPVELFVMARCPDARVCEATFDRILSRVGDIIDIRLTYIAQLAPSGEAVEPTCMHGPLECLAARQQLCVAHGATADAEPSPVAVWYRFVRCQNQHREDVGSSWLAEYCADKVGLRYAGPLQTCAEGSRGLSLLVESARRAILKNVHTSCTVYLEDKPRCVRDGGVWRECPAGSTADAFTRNICRIYRQSHTTWPLACHQNQVID
ncbi:hypothetical protein BDF22DRAFT_670972 [Syncephalis plumigaleata]|nr:hypothetical protein BDF22DRAFT_670972 [Syncephalis plumigaleata]